MKIKCDYCGGLYKEGKKACSHCGAINSGLNSVEETEINIGEQWEGRTDDPFRHEFEVEIMDIESGHVQFLRGPLYYGSRLDSMSIDAFVKEYQKIK